MVKLIFLILVLGLILLMIINRWHRRSVIDQNVPILVNAAENTSITIYNISEDTLTEYKTQLKGYTGRFKFKTLQNSSKKLKVVITKIV